MHNQMQEPHTLRYRLPDMQMQAIYDSFAEKIKKYLNSRQVWSKERANEILSYYIPRKAEWNAEEKCFYFADNGMGWGMKCHQKKIKWKDRRWWNCNRGFWGGKIRTYLIEKFEMEGFEKIVGDTYDQWAEITFKLIEK